MPPIAPGKVNVTDAGAKKERVKRAVWHPENRDEKGRLKTKIVGKDVGDFDPKKHLPLSAKDFDNPADYYELSADRLEKKVASLREKSVRERKLGNVADRVKARKFQGLHEKFAKMEAELRASGMSDDSIASLLAG